MLVFLFASDEFSQVRVGKGAAETTLFGPLVIPLPEEAGGYVAHKFF